MREETTELNKQRTLTELHNQRMNIESMMLSLVDDYLFYNLDKEMVKEKALEQLLEYSSINNEIMEIMFGINNKQKEVTIQ